MRVLSILNLCIVFSMICWYFGLPFTEDLYLQREMEHAYQQLTGDPALIASYPEHRDRLLLFKQFFTSLPEGQQTFLVDGYEDLKEEMLMPASEKLKHSALLLAFDLPPFKRAWILFVLVISIMVLKEAVGYRQVVWLLPLITLCYVVDNGFFGTPQQSSSVDRLFPSEGYLAETYLGHPIEGTLEEQKSMLQEGWDRYLQEEWAPRVPGEERFVKERGEYAFFLARLEAQQDDYSHRRERHHSQEPFLLLALYLGWNLFFAWRANCKKAIEPPFAIDSGK